VTGLTGTGGGADSCWPQAESKLASANDTIKVSFFMMICMLFLLTHIAGP